MLNKAELNEIRRLLTKEFKSPKEIMEILNIAQPTYYRYQKRILREDRYQLQQQENEEREHHIMQVRRSLQYCISKCYQICEDKDSDASEKLAAHELMIQASMGLVALDDHGPHSKVVQKVTKQIDIRELPIKD